jgi:hypothetical protein
MDAALAEQAVENRLSLGRRGRSDVFVEAALS